MDFTINNLSNCQICFNPFSLKENCPRMLTCGHTYCHSCLERFISEGSVCPTCKNDIPFVYANDIPINQSVKCLSETASKTKNSFKFIRDTLEAAAAAGLNNIKESLGEKMVTKKNELAYEGYCEEHCLPNHFKCMNCNKYICGTCVVLMHKCCTKVLPVLEALNLMKGENLKKIKVFKTKLEKETKMLDLKLDILNRKQEKLYQEIESVATEVKETKTKKERNQKLCVHSSCHEENIGKATCNEDYQKVDAKVKFFLEENCANIYLSPTSVLSKEEARKLTKKDLKENTYYVMKGTHEDKKYAKVKVEENQISFDEWVGGVEGRFCGVDFLDFINSRTVVIDTHKFIEEHKKELHNPQLPKDRIKFSKVQVKGRELYFNLFKTSKDSDFVIQFGGLLKTLECCSVVPAEAFLKIQNLLGEVVITTDGGSPRALNFLLLASGIMDDSYQGTIFDINESMAGGGWKNKDNAWSLFPGVVEGIRDGGVYEQKGTKSGKREDVGGEYANQPNKLSLFFIWKKESSTPFITTFGRVKRGMEVVDQIREQLVNECGLIFNLP